MSGTDQMQEYIEKIKEKYDIPFGIEFLAPRSYDVSGQPMNTSQVHYTSDKSKVVVVGTVSNFRVKHRGKLANIYADMSDQFGTVMLSWISSGSAGESKKTHLQAEFGGKHCQAIGVVGSYGNGQDRFVFLNKVKLETVFSNHNNIAEMKPIPIYELKKGVKEFEISQVMKHVVSNYKENSTLPNEIVQKYQLPSIKESLEVLNGIHQVAADQLIYFAEANTIWHKRIQLEMIWKTLNQMESESINKASPSVGYEKKTLIELEGTLPFSLTDSQKRALGNIFKVFKNGKFERMLLQGDVGSGKTLVSIFASMVMLKSKFNQVAVIAPSTVLATQLAEEYEHMLEPIGVTVFRSIGVIKKRDKNKMQKALNGDSPVVVIGTTSVNSLKFQRLGLLIVDEEQKMGVKSKDKLLSQLVTPYQILMSATPIPRSLAQAIFGNVKVIKIQSKPAGRLPVLTKIVKSKESQNNLFKFIHTETKKGNKSLFVAPSISSGELASVEKILKLCEEYLDPGSFATIHGLMKESNIAETIEDFKNDKYQTLVATSMVEAGFSVPNMTTVVITGPDRFGLSQLHQIRGRGGRSAGVQAYCALFPLDFNLSEKARERLVFFSTQHDGFELSSEDLNKRGSGELVGNLQSGGGKLNFIEYAKEVEEMRAYLK